MHVVNELLISIEQQVGRKFPASECLAKDWSFNINFFSSDIFEVISLRQMIPAVLTGTRIKSNFYIFDETTGNTLLGILPKTFGVLAKTFAKKDRKSSFFPTCPQFKAV